MVFGRRREPLLYPAGLAKGVSGTGAANGMRAVPDVAMSASAHDGYIIVEDNNYYVIAGTSAASPSFAGVMALVVEAKGKIGQGNANPALYGLLNANRNPFHSNSFRQQQRTGRNRLHGSRRVV